MHYIYTPYLKYSDGYAYEGSGYKRVGRNMVDNRLTSNVNIGRQRALLNDTVEYEGNHYSANGWGHRHLT